MNYDGKRFFPNADLYTRLERIMEMGEKRVCIVQSGGLPSEAEPEMFQVADRFFEVLQVLDILNGPLEVEKDGELFRRRDLNVPSEIIVAYTYLPFSKQDHAYETGEANSARMAIEIPLKLGVSKVTAVDPHPPLEYRWVADLLSEKKYEMLTLMPRLLKMAKKSFNLDEPLVLSPPGKAKFKEAETLDLKKKRLDSYTVMFEGTMDVKDRDIILADDLVLSGSTLIKTREKLLEMGAKEVVCCVPHVLPLSIGEEKLRMLVEKLEGKFVTSNTVATKTFAGDGKQVDVTDLLAEWLMD
jgi:phosphoribosylpyrophosphate synthetase